MVWSEYLDEAQDAEKEFDFNGELLSETDDVPVHQRLDYEDWVEWFSQDLLNMWMTMNTYIRDAGIHAHMMTHCDFEHFCWFAYQGSHGYPSVSKCSLEKEEPVEKKRGEYKWLTDKKGNYFLEKR